jgi:endonuclease-8
MAEGDSIWRMARTLDAVLTGRVVTEFESRLVPVQAAARRHRLVGQMVQGVEARGKHLILRFENGATLHTHMGLRGSWHLYRTSSRWRRPRTRARVVLTAGDAVAVCFNPALVELLSPEELRRHLQLRSLGPDAARSDFDAAHARKRLADRGAAEIGVALLDQRALAGVGNVFKSEVLFLCGVNPFVTVDSLPEKTLDAIVCTAAEQLRRSIKSGERRTTSALAPGALWVYGRGGDACRRCGETVRRAFQGEQRRVTYWCPRCQPAPAESEPPPVPA